MAVRLKFLYLSTPCMDGVRAWLVLILLSGLGLCNALSATAASNDLRVLTDDISATGTKNVEFQTSFARPSSIATRGSGLVFQGLAELAYGCAEHWEISAQMPVTRLNGGWHINGINAELQYAAPHEDDGGFYWGARAELGYASPVGDERTWQTEFRPVLGYRYSDWHFVINPAVTAALSGQDRKAKFEPSAKVSYQLDKRNAAGAEYLVEAGPLSHILPRSQRSELAFLVLDSKIGKSDVSIGVGRGLTDASDRWVVKLTMSAALD